MAEVTVGNVVGTIFFALGFAIFVMSLLIFCYFVFKLYFRETVDAGIARPVFHPIKTPTSQSTLPTEVFVMDLSGKSKQQRQRSVDKHEQISPVMQQMLLGSTPIQTPNQLFNNLPKPVLKLLEPVMGSAFKQGAFNLTKQQMDAIEKFNEWVLGERLQLEKSLITTRVARAETAQIIHTVTLMFGDFRIWLATCDDPLERFVQGAIFADRVKQFLLSTQLEPATAMLIHEKCKEQVELLLTGNANSVLQQHMTESERIQRLQNDE